MDTVTITILAVVLLYQLFVSIFVMRSIEYSRFQKYLQLSLVWLLPLLGAVIAHIFMWNHRTPPQKPDKDFTPQDTGAA